MAQQGIWAILQYSKKYNFSETGSVSVLRWTGRYLVQWVHYKRANPINPATEGISSQQCFPLLHLADHL